MPKIKVPTTIMSEILVDNLYIQCYMKKIQLRKLEKIKHCIEIQSFIKKFMIKIRQKMCVIAHYFAS